VNKKLTIPKILTIPKKDFGRLFNLAFCVTIHKSQGATFTENYTIHEWTKLDKKLRYVAVTRTSNYKNIHISI
jgi:hypothetical protein